MENNNGTNHPNSGKPYRNHERAERITIIHRLVYDATYNGKKVTMTQMATACGVDARTIYDDRAYMARHDMPMKFYPKENTWKFTKNVDYNPRILMSEGVFFTLMVAEKALRECHCLEKRQLLLKVFRQISAQFKDIVSFDLDGMDDCLSVATMLQPKFDPARVEYLLKCCAKRIELNLIYDTPKKGKKPRRIQPIYVHKAETDWVLFCFDFDRNKIIRMLLGRMYDITESGNTFERHPFDIEKALNGALIIYTCDEDEELFEVGLKFTNEVAHIIRENNVRCDVGREESPDGGLALKLKLGSLMDLPRLIGPHGANAYPLYPPRLVQEYIDTARAMLKAVGASDKE